MNTKKFFTGLTALALSIGLVLTGCEGPTGADGAGGGGPGASGEPTVATIAAALALLANPSINEVGVVADSPIAIAVGTIPAGKTLNLYTATTLSGELVVNGTLNLGVGVALIANTGGSLLLTIQGGAVNARAGSAVVAVGGLAAVQFKSADGSVTTSLGLATNGSTTVGIGNSGASAQGGSLSLATGAGFGSSGQAIIQSLLDKEGFSTVVASAAEAAITVSSDPLVIPAGKSLLVVGGYVVKSGGTNLVELSAGTYKAVGADVSISESASTFTVGTGGKLVIGANETAGITIGGATDAAVTYTATTAAVTFSSQSGANEGGVLVTSATGNLSTPAKGSIVVGTKSRAFASGDTNSSDKFLDMGTTPSSITNNGEIDLTGNAGNLVAAVTVTNNGLIKSITTTQADQEAFIKLPGTGTINLGGIGGGAVSGAVALTQNVVLSSTGKLTGAAETTPFSGTGKSITLTGASAELVLDAASTSVGVPVNSTGGKIKTATTSSAVLSTLLTAISANGGTGTIAATGDVTALSAALTVPQGVTLTTVTGATFATGGFAVKVDGTWTVASAGATLAEATSLEVNGLFTAGTDIAGTALSATSGIGTLDVKAATLSPAAISPLTGVKTLVVGTVGAASEDLAVAAGTKLVVNTAYTIKASQKITLGAGSTVVAGASGAANLLISGAGDYGVTGAPVILTASDGSLAISSTTDGVLGIPSGGGIYFDHTAAASTTLANVVLALTATDGAGSVKVENANDGVGTKFAATGAAVGTITGTQASSTGDVITLNAKTTLTIGATATTGVTLSKGIIDLGANAGAKINVAAGGKLILGADGTQGNAGGIWLADTAVAGKAAIGKLVNTDTTGATATSMATINGSENGLDKPTVAGTISNHQVSGVSTAPASATNGAEITSTTVFEAVATGGGSAQTDADSNVFVVANG
jgi:hypothetical protein